ncbi:hypothetical protein ABZS86_15490 [Streptomyces sp. NPDC005355]|uniref:hypothetical protein n=1 Tax=Streptomyces sp. NPDC005355 TaxID=3157038 RepID=UPI0033B92CB4
MVGGVHGKTFATLDGLLTAGVAAGATRSAPETGDAMPAMTGLMRLDISKDRQARAQRLLDLPMDGLRAQPGNFAHGRLILDRPSVPGAFSCPPGR